MPIDSNKNRRLGSKALELTMRDVLSGMEEFVSMKALETPIEVMEILSIEPPESELQEPTPATPGQSGVDGAKVVNIDLLRWRKAV